MFKPLKGLFLFQFYMQKALIQKEIKQHSDNIDAASGFQ